MTAPGSIRSRRTDRPWPQIKAALEMRGINLRQLALSHGKSESYLRQVKRAPVPHGQAMIAAALGVDPATLWPTRYRRSGRPISRALWIKLYQPSIAPGRRLADSLPATDPERAA